MLEIKRSTLSINQIVDSLDHFPLILPSKLPHIKQSELPWIAIEAYLEGDLVALSLTEIYDEGFYISASLCSLTVAPFHQQKGIGSKIFAFTENYLKDKEAVTFLRLFYTQEDPSTPALEKILSSLNWGRSQTVAINCHYDFTLFNPSWMHRTYHLPSSMSFFPWRDLKPNEKQQINHLVKQQHVSPPLDPLLDEEYIDYNTSVGLRHKDEIIGWSVTHKTDPLTVTYRSLYLSHSFLGTGYGIQLLIESLRKHKLSGIPNALFEIDPNDIDPTWAYFIKRRLYPLTDRIEHIKQAIRTLKEI